MDKQELYLRTAFCCMACDGEIADAEIRLLKEYVKQNSVFDGINVEATLNKYISEINSSSVVFLNTYLQDISLANLTKEEEIVLAKIAIAMIEADKVVQYSEIRFFKKIRQRLSLSDNCILTIIPDDTVVGDKDYYLMQDVQESDIMDLHIQFVSVDDFKGSIIN